MSSNRDETYAEVAGGWCYPCGAIDCAGNLPESMLSAIHTTVDVLTFPDAPVIVEPRM